MKTLFSIILWLYWAVCIIGFFGIVVVLYLFTFFFDRFNTITNKTLKGLGWLMLNANPGWTINIKGADPKKISRPTIVIANHQSFMDLPLSYLLPWSMKWVSKKGLFHIPILGWIIYMTGHIGINRRSMKSAKKIDALVRPIQEGIPAMIFPEGTRTRTGEVQPFKNGAFKLAKKYNFNILPIVLNGGYEAMPAGSWRVSAQQEFTISVLDPLKVDEYDSVSELKATAFSLIREELHSF